MNYGTQTHSLMYLKYAEETDDGTLQVKTLWGSFEVSVLRLCEVMLQQFTGVPLPHDLTEFNTIAAQFSTLPLHFLTYHGQQDLTSVLKVNLIPCII